MSLLILIIRNGYGSSKSCYWSAHIIQSSCNNLSAEAVESEEIFNIYIAISKYYFDSKGIGTIDSDVPVIYEIRSFCSIWLWTVLHILNEHMQWIISANITILCLLAYEPDALAGDLKHADLALLKMTALYHVITFSNKRIQQHHSILTGTGKLYFHELMRTQNWCILVLLLGL
jgi:hypothetical protein